MYIIYIINIITILIVIFSSFYIYRIIKSIRMGEANRWREEVHKARQEKYEIILDLDRKITNEVQQPLNSKKVKRFFGQHIRALNKSKILTMRQAVERLTNLEHSIELKGYYQPETDVSVAQSTAVANLIQALDNQRNAIIQIGSLMAVKVTSNNNPQTIVRELSSDEIQFIERNQELLQNPLELFKALSQSTDDASRPLIVSTGQSRNISHVTISVSRNSESRDSMQNPIASGDIQDPEFLKRLLLLKDSTFE